MTDRPTAPHDGSAPHDPHNEAPHAPPSTSEASPPAGTGLDGTAFDGPVRPRERIVALDVLRGFAILGILLVNAPLFLQPLWSEVLGGSGGGALDRIASVATEAVAEGKFFTLFSLLFGLGVAMQMQRAERRGRPFTPFFVRRMAILLAIGAAHAFLLWWGDILLYYALFGFLLIPLRRAPARRAWRLAIVAVCVPLVLNVALFGLTRLASGSPEGREALQSNVEASIAGAERASEAALEAYRSSDVGAMIGVRVSEWGFSSTGILLNGMAFLVIAMFLLGLAIGKANVLEDLERHLGLVRRARAVGLAVGVPATIAWLLVQPESVFSFGPAAVVSTVAFVLGAPLLSIGYAASLVLALRDPAWQARLAPLAAVGRVALSAYLMQTLVMTTLAYGYGFGLYGRVGPAGALAIALVVLAVQIPLAVWWTRRFRFGPAEWLWRSLSYGRPQPMRRAVAQHG